MNEKEIVNKGYEIVDRNVYRKNGTLYTQHYGELKRIDSIEPSEIRGIIPEEYIREASQEVTEATETANDEVHEAVIVEHTSDDESSAMTLAGDFDSLQQTYKDFERVKRELLDKSDIALIKGKPFITRSGRCKIATAFNISTDILEKERLTTEGGVTWIVKGRATAPNGRYAEDYAMCSEDEIKQKRGSEEYIPEHNILTTAVTRALSRACMSLLGGNVTKEEVDY